MGKCKYCGSETGEGELFCADYGARLEEEKPEAVVTKVTEELPGGAAEKAAEAAAETKEAGHEEVAEPAATEATAPEEPAQEEATAEKKNAAEHKETAGHKGTAEPTAEGKTSGAETAAKEDSAGKKKKIGSVALIALVVLGLVIGFGARTVSKNLGSSGKRFLAG